MYLLSEGAWQVGHVKHLLESRGMSLTRRYSFWFLLEAHLGPLTPTVHSVLYTKAWATST